MIFNVEVVRPTFPCRAVSAAIIRRNSGRIEGTAVHWQSIARNEGLMRNINVRVTVTLLVVGVVSDLVPRRLHPFEQVLVARNQPSEDKKGGGDTPLQ